jgi:Protein of unknown function (DUF3000)
VRAPWGDRRASGPGTGPLRQTAGVPVSGVPEDAPPAFRRAVADLRARPLRPEVFCEDVPAPRRLAPWALAIAAEVVSGGEDLASGRFVLLHDPAGQEGWHGAWRVVVLGRSSVEAEAASDPLLGQVAWSWLAEALAARGVAPTGLGGTVTRVLSTRFGELAGDDPGAEVEVRGSWSPLPDDVGSSLLAWTDLLCTAAGLPPEAAGSRPLPVREP